MKQLLTITAIFILTSLCVAGTYSTQKTSSILKKQSAATYLIYKKNNTNNKTWKIDNKNHTGIYDRDGGFKNRLNAYSPEKTMNYIGTGVKG